MSIENVLLIAGLFLSTACSMLLLLTARRETRNGATQKELSEAMDRALAKARK